MSINRVIITGNLTRDAELRETNGNGTPVLNFSVAVNDRRRNQQTGEWEDYPNYIDCSLFGTRATALEQYLKKGTKVAIEGKLRWSSWEDKETGKTRSRINVLVDELEFMNRASGNGGNGGNAGSNDRQVAPTYDQPDASDEVPF